MGTPDPGHARRLARVAVLLITAFALFAIVAAPAAEAKGSKTIKGTNKADKIKGTKKADKINARGGNDKVSAKAGNDKVKGGSGKDKVKGGSGKDKVNSGSGKDKVAGGSGNDKLQGSTGKDTLKGGGGKDKLTGSKGKDKLIGGGGNDKLNALDDGPDKVSGGPGIDTCKIDVADQPLTTGCEKLTGPGAVDPPDPPLKISAHNFTCTPPATTGAQAQCNYTLSGSGADQTGGTITGTGGVTNVTGTPAANASGNWSASGTARCTANGGLSVTFNDETAATNVTCPAGPDDPIDPNGPLTLVLGTPVCTPAISPLPGICTFSLSGTGADTDSGELTSSGGLANVTGTPPSATGGNWTVLGGASCTVDGTLTITFGPEHLDVPVDCPTIGDNGPLTLVVGTPVCTPAVVAPPLPTVPGLCTFSLSGTGADTDSGSLSASGGLNNVTGTPPSALAGNWTVIGGASCTADGTLTITFGTEHVDVPVTCPTTGGGGGGDNGPLAVTAGVPLCTPAVVAPPLPTVPGVCSFSISGTGADTDSGSLSASGGLNNVTGTPPSALAGNWTVIGGASCTADGTLTITFGTEHVDVPATCPTTGGGGGGGGSGDLTIALGNPVTCTPPVNAPPLPTVPGGCLISLAGTGADGNSGTISATGGVSNVTGPPPSAAAGNWAFAGGASCSADGTLVVTFGTEHVVAQVNCG